jgi:hypothetical protein
MSNWKQRFSVFNRHSVEHEVGGQTFVFYPNSVGLLAEVRDLSAPVAKALASLMADKSGDISSQVRKEREGGYEVEVITTNAVAPEITTMRLDRDAKSIQELIETVCDPKSRMVIGKLLMDSLRAEFEYKKNRSAGEVEEFLYGDGKEYEGIPIPELVQMIGGWMKANAKVFGETGERMVAVLRGRLSPLSGEGTTTSGQNSSEPSSPQ